MIWKDEPWDFEYMLLVFRHKLASMQAHFESTRSICSDKAEISAEIAACVKDLDALIADEFCKTEWRNHFARWPDSIENGMSEECYHNSRMLIMLEDKRKKDCAERLFATLRDKYERWWD